MVQVRQQYTSDLRSWPTCDLRHDVVPARLGREADEDGVGPARRWPIFTEAALNIVLHAYKREQAAHRPCSSDADPQENLCLAVSLGPRFDPDHAPPPIFDGSKESGFGVYLIKETVDDVRYFARPRPLLYPDGQETTLKPGERGVSSLFRNQA